MHRAITPLVVFFGGLLIAFLLFNISVYGLANVLQFFVMIGGAILVLLLVSKLASREPAPCHDCPDTPLYQETHLDKPIGGTVTALSGSSARIDTHEGTSFIAHKQAGGITWIQQIDPRSGRYIGQPFIGMDKFGYPDDKAVTRHIKRQTRSRR